MEQKRYKLLLLIGAAAVLLVPALRTWGILALCALGLGGVLNGPVSALEERGLRRSWAAAAVVLGLLVVVLALLLFGVARGCEGIAEALNSCDPFSGLTQRLGPLLMALPDQLRVLAVQGIESFSREGNLLREQLTGWAAEQAAEGVSHLPGWLLALAVTVLGAYYAVSDWPTVKRELLAAVPRDWRGPVSEGIRHLKDGAVGWLSVQGRLLLIQFGILAVGLGLLRIQGFLLAAALVALVDALPLLGSGIALVPWAILLLLEGSGGKALGMVLLWLVLWLCRSILEPRLMGQRVGVTPVWTLLAIYLGVRTMGVVGLIAAPIVLAAVAELRRSQSGKEE